VREADNGQEFVERVLASSDTPIHVIPAEEEARLAFLSVCRTFDLRGMNTLVADIGGGSTEVILSRGDVVERLYALPIGAVRLTEQFGLGERPNAEQYRVMRKHVRRMLKDKVGKPPINPQLLIGTGGTFTNLGSMSIHRDASGEDVLPFAVRGYELQRSEVKHTLDRIRKMTTRDRSRVPGLNPDRADIIVAGLTIVEVLLKHFDVNQVRVSDKGVRAGMLYDMLESLGETNEAPLVDRMLGVRQFASACLDDQSHSHHVARLSLQLFDETAREFPVAGEADADPGAAGWATPANRELLHVAALLHDVGYLVNYSKHHKHSYHLILHSGLPGFSSTELEVVANIARYHRGAGPKPRHRNFARLGEAQQDLVRRLGGILRLAVGLDRSHTRAVSDVHVRRCDGLTLVEILSARHPSVELWGADHKGRLFQRAFDTRVRFSWTPDESEVGEP
jgi:exopolyphosphatase/guanosine-5'-triphosphate,3'-diphosphate pyrophosphatase